MELRRWHARLRAAPRETNDVDVLADGPSGVRAPPGAGGTVGGGGVLVGEGVAIPERGRAAGLELGEGDDKFRGRHSLPAVVDAGPGDDEYLEDPKGPRDFPHRLPRRAG